MTIGLLSDTHGFLDASLGDHFSNCDEIWHAGDIGDLHVTNTLARWKPLRAVYGNIDGAVARRSFHEVEAFDCGGVRVLLTHIGGKPPAYNPNARSLLDQHQPDVFICGHSHILQVKKDEARKVLFINPGAAGQHGFHVMRTAMRLQVDNGKIVKLEVIELGKRGIATSGA